MESYGVESNCWPNVIPILQNLICRKTKEIFCAQRMRCLKGNLNVWFGKYLPKLYTRDFLPGKDKSIRRRNEPKLCLPEPSVWEHEKFIVAIWCHQERVTHLTPSGFKSVDDLCLRVSLGRFLENGHRPSPVLKTANPRALFFYIFFCYNSAGIISGCSPAVSLRLQRGKYTGSTP